jgi:hypothetical protein
MIDTDKMRAAYAATPLCQNQWVKKDGNNPTMLCAISALVSFAGVQPDLILKMEMALPNFGGPTGWYSVFAKPVLFAEYGMPGHVADKIPGLFDGQVNEWEGVLAVLDLCERYNAAPDGPFVTIYGGVYGTMPDVTIYLTISAEPLPAESKKLKALPAKTKPGQSPFWTSSKKPWLAKQGV